MIAFFKLIRIWNLLIIALTQYLVRYCIIAPILHLNGFKLQLGEFHFFLLVLSTMLITAAGYIINDYFDRAADLQNRPHRVIIGNQIERRLAMKLHILLNTLGVLIGIYLSIYIRHYIFSIFFIVITGLLWYYSTTYKRMFFVGNLIVALLTGLVPFMVALFEIPLLNTTYKHILLQQGISFFVIIAWVCGFSYFAFITTLFREIIKDMEDFEGDYSLGRNSLPVVIGMFYTKLIVIALVLFTMFSLIFCYFIYLKNEFSLWYFIIALEVPMAFLIYKMIQAKDKSDYKFASTLSKIIMLIGIGYAAYLNIF